MNKLLDKVFDQGVGLGRKVSVFDALMGAFLMFNLVIRFSTIFYYPPYNGFIAVFFGVVVSCCILVILFPKYLKVFLFIFGFSFFLFGFGAIDIHSRVFELIVTCVATTLFVINQEKRAARVLNSRLVVFLLCYVGLSLFSLLLLPVRQIVKDVWFFGFPDSFFYLFIGPPYGIYFPVASVIQLMLFVVLAIQLSITKNHATPDPDFSPISIGPRYGSDTSPWVSSVQLSSREEPRGNYKTLFAGIFSGAVFCAFIGLLDFYGIISLAWYRFGTIFTPGVLHSTFQNRNCFGEFVLTVLPFVMIGFLSKIKGAWWKVFLFACLVICGIALILAGGRAGWVLYPFILYICWLFFFFSKEGRFDSFHFQWRDLVKPGLLVPITIVVSFLLIFYVLMPLSDALKERTNLKVIYMGSEGTTQLLKEQAERIGKLDIGDRIVTWGQGFNVGRESLVFGMGYESFLWHANILTKIPESDFDKFLGERQKIHDSPHNVFLSTFVSGGVVGVFLWVLIIGYSLMILSFDLIRTKRLLNIPVIISIISFHIFGLVQSMQYIPMIWLLIFLNLGYAMTIDERILSDRIKRVMSILTKISVVFVVISFFVYLSNFESRSLAEKYGLNIYAMHQDRDKFAGFFRPSKRWKYGDYRWSGKRAAIYVPGGGTLELEFHCRTPGVEEEAVVLTVSHDGKPLDKISFIKKGSVRKKYELQETPGKTERLVLEVSRTWIPHEHLGNFDRRKLGVGVRIVRRQF